MLESPRTASSTWTATFWTWMRAKEKCFPVFFIFQNMVIHPQTLLFRLLEGHLCIVLQPTSGAGQLQKRGQPGGQVPAQVQAASQPGSSVRPDERRTGARVLMLFFLSRCTSLEECRTDTSVNWVNELINNEICGVSVSALQVIF